MAPVSVFDVAKYILESQKPMTTMKLQKLVYYCQAWSLVWDDEPLFTEEIEAWANGPIVRELFCEHRGQFMISKLEQGNIGVLNPNQIDTINTVLSYYGDKSSQWLSNLTHSEAPWRDAREGLSDSERGSRVISHGSMAEYYSSL